MKMDKRCKILWNAQKRLSPGEQVYYWDKYLVSPASVRPVWVPGRPRWCPWIRCGGLCPWWSSPSPLGRSAPRQSDTSLHSACTLQISPHYNCCPQPPSAFAESTQSEETERQKSSKLFVALFKGFWKEYICKSLPHLFSNNDKWIRVLWQKVENAPDFESVFIWDEESFKAEIFIATQSPAHLVKLHYVKLLPYLPIKTQHSVRVTLVCHQWAQCVYKC